MCYRTKRFSDTQGWRDGQQWLATVTCDLKKLPVFFRTFEKQSLCQTHDHIISSLISSLSIVSVGHWISSDQLMLVYWTHAVSVMGTTFHCTSTHHPVWLWYTVFIANNNELRCVCWSILQSIGLRWKEETAATNKRPEGRKGSRKTSLHISQLNFQAAMWVNGPFSVRNYEVSGIEVLLVFWWFGEVKLMLMILESILHNSDGASWEG